MKPHRTLSKLSALSASVFGWASSMLPRRSSRRPRRAPQFRGLNRRFNRSRRRLLKLSPLHAWATSGLNRS